MCIIDCKGTEYFAEMQSSFIGILHTPHQQILIIYYYFVVQL